LKTAQHRRTRV